MPVITPPSVEPVTREQAKVWLRVDYAEDDALIDVLISAAREKAEHYTNRHFLTTTVEEKFPVGSPIVLNHGPVLSIVSVGVDGQPLPTDAYTLLDCKVFPEVQLKSAPAAAPTVRYTVGYGPTVNDVPKAVGQAILLMVGDMYENRTDTLRRLPTASMHLLNTVRRWIT